MFSKKSVSASPKLDIWAMGCILYSMVLGYLPFIDKTENSTIKKILE